MLSHRVDAWRSLRCRRSKEGRSSVLRVKRFDSPRDDGRRSPRRTEQYTRVAPPYGMPCALMQQAARNGCDSLGWQTKHVDLYEGRYGVDTTAKR